MRRKWLVVLGIAAICTVVLGAAYALRGDLEVVPAPESAIVVIPLIGGPERPDAEISGLAWYRDEQLVLLPQYPSRFGDAVFAIDKRTVEAAITSRAQGPIAVRRVPLEIVGLEDAIPHFDGFEAIVIDGEDVYVSIEARPDPEHTVGYLLRGRVEGDLERIVLDPTHRARMANQTDLLNTGYEALAIYGEHVIAFYEANGTINPRPRALRFDRALEPRGALRLATLEYRVTDATSIDAEGRFWVANYHWPGSPWQVGSCDITERHGRGASHARCATVERIVELQITNGRVTPTARPPILLELIDDAHARNWEGVVRLDDRGFLLVTDEYPRSILAFVPLPD